MRRFLACILLFTVILPTTAGAGEGDLSSLSAPLDEVPFALSAPSVLLVEAESGRVIFEKNADERRQVASITKLMTLLLVFEAMEAGRLSLTDQVEVSQRAASMGGSQALLDAGGVYPAEELVKSVIVASANDAAVALSENLYGSEEAFVRRMNERAAELGLADTHYANCTGLADEAMVTTARDVAQLSRVMAGQRQFFAYSGIWLDEILHKNDRRTELANTNRLIRTYEGADGFKTGSTSEALYCISASAVQGGMRLIAVVLGAPTSAERFAQAAKMLDYGFAHYYMADVLPEGTVVAEDVPVRGSGVSGVDAVVQSGVRAMMRKGEEGDLAYAVELPEFIQAPMLTTEPIGEVTVRKNGEVIAVEPVVVAKDLPEQGFLGGIVRIIASWML